MPLFQGLAAIQGRNSLCQGLTHLQFTSTSQSNRSIGESLKAQQFLKQRIAKHSLTRRILRSTRLQLHELGIAPPRLKIRYTASSRFPYDAIVSRKPDHFVIEIASSPPPSCSKLLRARAFAPVYFLINCPPVITELAINLGDGNHQSAALFAFSGSSKNVVLLPDIYFLNETGFSTLRQVADSASHTWKSRKSTLRWRGTNTGAGRQLFGQQAVNDATVNARIRMCIIADCLPDTDCRFAATELIEDRSLFAHFGMLAEPIPESDWINDRYAIDVDGHTNTWSNMIARMHLGCCVLKVESQFGYRQWYYDHLKPGIHFVPVKADMSDLGDKLDWVRKNPEEAETIAQAGQAFVRTMTLESETRRAVEIITQAVGAN